MWKGNIYKTNDFPQIIWPTLISAIEPPQLSSPSRLFVLLLQTDLQVQKTMATATQKVTRVAGVEHHQQNRVVVITQLLHLSLAFSWL